MHNKNIHVTRLRHYGRNIFSLVFSSDQEIISYLCCICTVTFFMHRPWPLISLVWHHRDAIKLYQEESWRFSCRDCPVAVRSDSDPLLLTPSTVPPCTPTAPKPGSGLSHVTSVIKNVGA